MFPRQPCHAGEPVRNDRAPRVKEILSDLAYVVRRLEEYCSSDEIRCGSIRLIPSSKEKGAVDLIHDGQLVDVLQVLDRLDADGYL